MTRLRVNGGGKLHIQPTVAVVKRRCPRCRKRRQTRRVRVGNTTYRQCVGCGWRWPA